MFKKNSDNSQDRERRKATHNRANTGGIDRSTFKSDASTDELKMKVKILGDQAAQTELKLARVKSMAEEASLRRGTWGGRAVTPEAEARILQEKRLLLGDLTATRAELLKYKRLIIEREGTPQQNRDETNKTFETIFHTLAKEMLAGPVYDRIAVAAIHRIGNNKETS